MFKLIKEETTTLGNGKKTYTVKLLKEHMCVHSYTSEKSMEDAEKAFSNVIGSLATDLAKEVGEAYVRTT